MSRALHPSPTPRQLQVLVAVDLLTLSLDCAPTLRELGEELSISSTNGVADHVRRLRARGWLDWHPGRARTLRLTALGARFARAEAPREAA